jgi:pimeloyl-ACP methyl ester carboxylesterase
VSKDPLATPCWHDRLALSALGAAGFRRRWLDCPLGPLHALEARGAGSLGPILLLHGLGSCAIDYLPLLLRLLPLHQRVYAVDLPGHGQSVHPPLDIDTRALEEALFVALEGLSDEPLLVFGCSLGGLVALRLAAARPDRVRAVMVASPAGAPMSPAEIGTLLKGFRLRDHAEALAFVDRFAAHAGPARHVLAWGARRRFRTEPIPRLLARISASDLLSPDELARVRAPVTLFWGLEDRVLPPAQMRFFLEHLPSVRAQAAEGFGHAPFLDRPRAFLAHMEAFARAAS